MGYLALYDMLDNAGPDIAIDWHLANNFYPYMEDGARQVAYMVYDRIKAGTYEPDEVIAWTLANGDTQYIKAGEVVRACHLEAFIEYFANKGRSE